MIGRTATVSICAIVAGKLHPIGALYDRIGIGYSHVRGEDPRIAAAIWAALGDARTVVNVGAGTGSYEPRDREVTAVEPSEEMIAQRPPGAAPVVRASAEALPFEDGAFDASMAVLTDHHWPDRVGGLRELRRVARRRAVLVSFDNAVNGSDWLTRDYLTAFRPGGLTIEEIADCLGGARIEPLPVPADCRDGFFHAYWRRPHAYLDPRVRDGISVFRLLLPREHVEAGMAALRADLESGEWERRNAHILELDEMDLGYRLLVAES